MSSLVSLFNDISTFMDYLMPKPSFQNSSDTIQAIAGRVDKGVHTFPLQGYLSESERNSATGVWTRLL